MRRTHAQYQVEATPLIKEIHCKVRNHTDYKSIKSPDMSNFIELPGKCEENLTLVSVGSPSSDDW